MRPVTAAAGAVNGLAKNVREFGPCRPSKFLFEVETQYLPAGILSSFMAKQALHPGSLKGIPAASKILSKPSLIACCSTCFEPGTTHTVTLSAFFLPFRKL